MSTKGILMESSALRASTLICEFVAGYASAATRAALWVPDRR